jgi:hypothetical protein
MKTILLSFILITNQPNGLTVPEARASAKIAVEKLNTLTPYKFKLLKIIRMKDPFRNTTDYFERLGKWNKLMAKKRNAATYIHVWDKPSDPTTAGIAYFCDPVVKKGQVSISRNVSFDVDYNTSIKNFPGLTAAHEIGHQLGFTHVGIHDDYMISIMDEDLFWYRFARNLKRFLFYDKVDALKEFGCAINAR